MRLLVNHMQGKIYVNIFATNASFASNVNFKFRHACNCMSIKNTLYFTHKSPEGQLKHWENLINAYLLGARETVCFVIPRRR